MLFREEFCELQEVSEHFGRGLSPELGAGLGGGAQIGFAVGFELAFGQVS